MAKINLKVNAERVFGHFLPTVYLKVCQVLNNEAGITEPSRNDVIFNCDLAISFTKPDTMTRGEAHKFLLDNLGDLYLYTWISPFEELNAKLELNRLNIIDLFDANERLRKTDADTFNSNSVFFPYVYGKALEAWNNGDYVYGFEPTSGTDSPSDIRNRWDGATFNASAIHGLYETIQDVQLAAGLFYILYPGEITGNMPSWMHMQSLPNLFMFGPNPAGPWNKPDTITIQEVNNRATVSANALGFRSDIDASNPTQREIDEQVEAMGGHEELGWSAAPTTAAEFAENMVRDMLTTAGAGFDSESPTISSYMYEHSHKFFADTKISQLSNYMDQHKKIKLRDLIKPVSEGGYGGNFNSNREFDSAGREILQITNITVPFHFNSIGIDDREVANAVLSSITRLFFIGTIGIDIQDAQGAAFEGNKGFEDDVEVGDRRAVREVHRSIFNGFFGNITYEHVMHQGVVPNPYFVHFVYSDDKSPYDDTPIQGLDGKFYANEPYSRNNMNQSFRKLITHYMGDSKGDRLLANNLNNLRLVIDKYSNTPNYVRELKKFQRTFTDKSRRLKSGQFYSDFIDILTTMNRKITNQEPVLRRLSVNSTCIDMRPAFPTHYEYSPPEPNLNKYAMAVHKQRGEFSGDPSDYQFYSTKWDTCKTESPWIPQNWAKMTREILFIDAGSELGAHETTPVGEKILEDAKEEFAGMPGADGEFLADYVEAEMREVNTAYTELGTSISTDQVCKNWGYFFFDYEKAMYMESFISSVVDLKRLFVFFSLGVPYEYYQVQQVSMNRYDLKLDVASRALDSAIGTYDVVQTIMTSYFDLNKKVPEIYKTTHMVSDGNHWSPINDDEKAKYGKPYVQLVPGNSPDGSSNPKTEYSSIQYVHFGLGDNVSIEHSQGGLDFGGTGTGAKGQTHDTPHTMVSFIPFAPHSKGAGSLKNHDGIGLPYDLLILPLKSYRLMAFEFTDFMDDDVALAGTASDVAEDYQSQFEMSGHDLMINGTIGRESKSGEQLAVYKNPFHDRGSWYQTSVCVRDRTIDYFCTVYETFVKPFVESYEEYVGYAEELCSYNKSTESFNDFFVQAMTERYVSFAGRMTAEQTRAQLEALMGEAFSVLNAAAGGADMGSAGADQTMVSSNIKTLAKNIPPWVSGALLSAFIKQLFFGTPGSTVTHARQIMHNLISPLSNYDPDSGEAPPYEAIKLMREMYQLSPHKGNIAAIRTFKNRLQPLIDVLELKDENIKQRIADLTGVDIELPHGEFITQARNARVTRYFYGSIPIDAPIVPGAGTQGYYGGAGLKGRTAGGSAVSEYSGFYFDKWLSGEPGEEIPGLAGEFKRPTLKNYGNYPLVTVTETIEIPYTAEEEKAYYEQQRREEEQAKAEAEEADRRAAEEAEAEALKRQSLQDKPVNTIPSPADKDELAAIEKARDDVRDMEREEKENSTTAGKASSVGSSYRDGSKEWTGKSSDYKDQDAYKEAKMEATGYSSNSGKTKGSTGGRSVGSGKSTDTANKTSSSSQSTGKSDSSGKGSTPTGPTRRGRR